MKRWSGTMRIALLDEDADDLFCERMLEKDKGYSLSRRKQNRAVAKTNFFGSVLVNIVPWTMIVLTPGADIQPRIFNCPIFSDSSLELRLATESTKIRPGKAGAVMEKLERRRFWKPLMQSRKQRCNAWQSTLKN